MTLQTAKNRIKKAVTAYLSPNGIEQQRFRHAHYPSNAKKAAMQKLSVADCARLQNWYDKQNIPA